MSEKTKNPTNNEGEKAAKKPVASGKPTTPKKEKRGFFRRVKDTCHVVFVDHKREWLAGAVGAIFGAGGTIGGSAIYSRRKNRQVQVPQQPNQDL